MVEKRRVHQSPERAQDRARNLSSPKQTANRTSRVEKRRQLEFAAANRVPVPGARKNTADNLRQTAGGAASSPGRRKK